MSSAGNPGYKRKPIRQRIGLERIYIQRGDTVDTLCRPKALLTGSTLIFIITVWQQYP